MQKHGWLTALVVALYLLHQDVWLWRSAQPVWLGIFPPGLSYHIGFTLAVVVLMGLLVRFAWPAHLESEADEAPEAK